MRIAELVPYMRGLARLFRLPRNAQVLIVLTRVRHFQRRRATARLLLEIDEASLPAGSRTMNGYGDQECGGSGLRLEPLHRV
jgi:hypothetical protein